MKSICIENNDISATSKLVKDQILNKFGQATFDSWFVNISIAEIAKNFITFKVKSKFIKEWINCNYYDDLLQICQGLNDSIVKIDFITDSNNLTESQVSNVSNINFNSEKLESSTNDFSGSINKKYDFSSFITGEENIVAFSAAQNLANNLASESQSQILYIHSNVGLGKTHLAQSIANQVSDLGNINVAYFSAERFAYNYVKFIREGNIIEFKDFFSSVNLLIIDDIQFLAGKKSTQEELLHVINSFVAESKSIVLTGDKSLTELENVDKRILSKISAGFVTKINNPQKQLLARIVYSRFQKININISEYWLRNIVDTIASIRDIEGILSKFHALKSINQKYNFDNLMHVIMNDYVGNTKNEKVTIDSISDVVVEYYNLKKSDIKSKQRLKKIVRARQVIMYLAKELTSESLDHIGRQSANRNHATVIHSVKSIETQLLSDANLVKELDFIKSKL
ncbi:MAG: chromosomal replication initiator protein DnaA [Rickettsiales bacterium]|nr:chromosomal replication initiator protein DnaA [Rickettsiales bacterium]